MARTFRPQLAALALVLMTSAALADPVAIYPTAGELPANHLKFYLHFAEPMREGVFLDHCTLLDDRDHRVLEPFREAELWSDDRRRLTLWLHPGRQKTGVNLNVEFGPVLEPGRSYKLRIAGAWPTARGTPLGPDIVKTFRTGPRIVRQLDSADWKITAPAAGTRQPLEVGFPAPLDRALLLRCLSVTDANGAKIIGEVGISTEERSWRFTPAKAWPASEHRLEAETVLEDLAGNSLARPFEVDLSAAPPRAVPRTLSLSFHPRRD